MEWKKAGAAAEAWCGGISEKSLYAAVRSGRLKAARIGAGRNLLFCETWCDEWLKSTASDGAASERNGLTSVRVRS
jgi:hypothetical protein